MCIIKFRCDYYLPIAYSGVARWGGRALPPRNRKKCIGKGKGSPNQKRGKNSRK